MKVSTRLVAAMASLLLSVPAALLINESLNHDLAKSRAPATIDESCQKTKANNKLTVTSFNVFLRPTLVFDDGQIARSKILSNYLKDDDLLVLVEAFDDEAREILLRTLNNKFPYKTKILGSDGMIAQDGGVLIASCWPILEEDELLFGEVCENKFSDCMAEKGVKYAKINKGGIHFHIFATHLEAGFKSEHRKSRIAELKLISNFIKSKRIPKDDMVLISGDFNINLIQDKAPQTTQNEYKSLLKILDVVLPTIEGVRYTCDPRYNDLADKSIPPEFIDYIFYVSNFKTPSQACLEVMDLRGKTAWSADYSSKEYYDLSDHFPVRATFQF